MPTIPASTIVSVQPSVLSAGGNALDLIGLILTENTRVPIGTVPSFPSTTAVDDFFGATSAEAGLAQKYFAGFDGSTAKPGALLFAQYPTAPVAAYLRGGDVSSLSLTALQAIAGTLSVTIDASPESASIDLAAATSFSNAAQIIADDLGIVGASTAVVTASMGAAFTGTGSGTNLTVTAVTGVIHPGDTVSGTGVPGGTTIVSQSSGSTGGAGVYVTSQATTSDAASLTTTSTTLDVTGVTSGTVGTVEVITGSGVTDPTYIVSQGTGIGGTGTYITDTAQHFASTQITVHVPGVTYDSVSGAFIVNSGTTGASSTIGFASGSASTALKLTSATGAVTSQGAIAAVPATFMNAIIAQTQNWATFLLAFDPDDSGFANKLAFSAWTNAQDDRYAFICWDTDAAAAGAAPATSTLGYAITQAAYSGTELIYQPTDSANPVASIGAFQAGAIASIDFAQPNGRTTMAFRTQAGLTGEVTDQTVAANLEANGYNYFGAFATANQGFVFFYPGSISGEFKWVDSFVNEIWMNAAFQLSLMNLLTNSFSIPYNNAGAAMIEVSLADAINAALAFGSIRAGVVLSASQIVQVNSLAGANIATTLQTRGWYLKVGVASPTVRAARGSPPCQFFYVDGQSIQRIDLASIALQ